MCKECLAELFPPDGYRCAICRDKINTEGLCSACLECRPDYDFLYVPYTFDGLLRLLLHDFKFKNGRYLMHPFGEMVADALPKNISEMCDIIVPVPVSPKRLKQRGYNQAFELAKEVSALTGIPVDNTILKKRNGQKQMALLNKSQRRENIKDFYYCEKKISGKRILIVDDICTTGETLRACARELKLCGASRILCACVARTDLSN